MATKEEMALAVAAVKAGWITPAQVQECMDLQRRLHEQGKPAPLVHVFIAKSYLNKDQAKSLTRPLLPKSVTVAQANQIEGFDVIEKIGEGGVASVFRAYCHELGFDVALKVLFPVHTSNETFVERFHQEAQLLIDFDHVNLVKGFQYGTDPGVLEDKTQVTWYWVSMELIEGQSVLDDLNANGPMDEGKALHIICQIAEALDYLRTQNCVHRDIKPDNILYDLADGDIKLCDLGFAKEVEEGREGEIENVTCGTVQYISPEQARGLADVDVRADIYSLGATLFHLVIGEVPFGGKDSMDIMAKQVLESLASDKYRKRGLSQFIGYFIEKMMAKERAERYQSPREMIEDIQAVVKGAQDLIYRAEGDAGIRQRRSVPQTPAPRAPRRTAPLRPPAGGAKPQRQSAPRRTRTGRTPGRTPKPQESDQPPAPRRLSRLGGRPPRRRPRDRP